MPEVLLIDDNREILDAHSSYLSKNGFTVTVADSGLKAASLISSRSFDCIVLDILLPDLDGYAICKAARTVTNAPILFLSCLDEIDEKTHGLMLGGDDYMTKPYSLRELSARLHALVRRSEGPGTPDGDFYVEPERRLIHTKRQSAILSKKEFALFLLFYENPGVLFRKETLLEKIWERDEAANAVTAHTVTVHIARLRKKIAFAEDRIGYIESAYGSGYRLTPPERRNAGGAKKRGLKMEDEEQ